MEASRAMKIQLQFRRASFTIPLPKWLRLPAADLDTTCLAMQNCSGEPGALHDRDSGNAFPFLRQHLAA